MEHLPRPESVSPKPRRIAPRLLISLAAILVVLLFVYAYASYTSHQDHIDDDAQSRVAAVGRLLPELLRLEAKSLSSQIDFLGLDKGFQEAWRKKDRGLLLARSEPLFKRLKSDYDVTHLYFIELDKTCFLRVHGPAKHGDVLSLAVLDKAARDDRPEWGVSLGKFGTVTLRVVHPWKIDGRTVGYLELGMEVDHITPELKQIVGADIVVAVSKQAVTRTEWQQGLATLGKKGDWDEFSQFVVVGNTMPFCPPELTTLWEHDCEDHYRTIKRFSHSGRTFGGGVAPLVDAGGIDVGDFLVLTDITDHVAAARHAFAALLTTGGLLSAALLAAFYWVIRGMEREVLAANNSLRDEARRSNQIEQSLREAILAAEAADRAKSRFLANMSHEIRTPLTGILGFTELLTGATLDETQRVEYLNTIRASGRHLLALINDILDLSKIEAGQMDFEWIRCRPHQLLAEVASALRPKALEKGVVFECGCEGAVPETIRSDPARLRQLLYNLASNAVKFTERGCVRLNMRLDREGPKPRLVLSVTDTGPGIPPDKLEAIFSPFVQADTSVTRKHGGTGLGLPISREIARGLGGDLSVSSEPGKGSMFTAVVETGPLDGVAMVAEGAFEAVIRKDRRDRQPAGPPPTLPPVDVLVVEDGATNRKLISLFLERAGARVTTADDGQQALDAVAQRKFDLILMDIQMPVMDGFTATTKLRQRGMTLPIIALTAHAMKGDDEKCRAAGCSGYLAKPIDFDQLLRTVAAALVGQTSQVSSPGALSFGP